MHLKLRSSSQCYVSTNGVVGVPTIMSDFWVSEDKVWCKYCKKYISSNKIQIRQHEAGLRHIRAEDEFVRLLASKAKPAAAAASASSFRATAEAGELLERISQWQREAEIHPEQAAVDDESFPVPAHDALGEWVKVPKQQTFALETDRIIDKHEDTHPEEAAIVLRVGAMDAADEEEAAARDEATVSKMKDTETDDVFDGLDMKRKKRAMGKGPKRKRQRIKKR